MEADLTLADSVLNQCSILALLPPGEAGADPVLDLPSPQLGTVFDKQHHDEDQGAFTIPVAFPYPSELFHQAVEEELSNSSRGEGVMGLGKPSEGFPVALPLAVSIYPPG